MYSYYHRRTSSIETIDIKNILTNITIVITYYIYLTFIFLKVCDMPLVSTKKRENNLTNP
jgi:hypothetical protein